MINHYEPHAHVTLPHVDYNILIGSDYPPVIKHGNGKYTIHYLWVIFLLKPQFRVDFQLPLLITAEGMSP